MSKDDKRKVNQAVIELKAKQTELKDCRSQDQMSLIIKKASEILEKLELWRSMVQDEEFVRALQLSKTSTESNEFSRLGISMLEAFLAKDFLTTQELYEEIIDTQTRLSKTENRLLDEITKSMFSLILTRKDWQSFGVILSSILSMIIEDHISIDSEDSKDQSQRGIIKKIDSIGSSEIGWLFMWANNLGKSTLILTARPDATHYIKIKCKYHMDSHVDVMFAGTESQLLDLTYTDLRKKLKSKFKLEFVFIEMDRFILSNENEQNCLESRSSLNTADKQVIIGLFLPFVNTIGSFDHAIQVLVEKKNGVLLASFMLQKDSSKAYYVSSTTFGDDILKYEVSKMILAKNRMNFTDQDIRKMMNYFKHFVQPQQILNEYVVPYDFDPRQSTILTSIDILSELTGTNVSSQVDSQDIVIISGLKQSLNLKVLLGEAWSHGKSNYKLSYIDDSLAIYEKQPIINND